MKYLEFFAAAIGVCSIWLLIRRDVRAFPIGIVMVSLYAYIFWIERLYSDMLLQGFFAAMQAHGWAAWQGGAKAADQRIAIRQMTRKQWVWTLAFAAAGTGGLGYLMYAYTNADIPWLDAFTTTLSVIAQLRLNRRYLDNWLLWIGVDTVYLFQYSIKALYFTTGLYAVFLAMAFAGYKTWRAQYKIQINIQAPAP